MGQNSRNWPRRIGMILIISLLLFCSAISLAWAEPRIISVSPTPLSQQNVVNQVYATVVDAPGSFQLTIDGTVVTPNRAGDTITYTSNLAPGLHKAYLTVADNGGLSAEKYWMFYVNDPVSNYLLPNNTDCENCHADTFYNYPGHMENMQVTKGHPYNCGACHYYGSNAPSSQLLLRPDGTAQIIGCNACHAPHRAISGPLLIPPAHNNTNWIGNWSAENNAIKAPRENMDCQYCHQPGTRVRLGHDLVADHEIEANSCTKCHSKILTITHNKPGRSCDTCHNPSDPAMQNIVKTPQVAKAGLHITQIGMPTYIETSQYYNDLNLNKVSISVYSPNSQAFSWPWSPGLNLEIKRVTVDGWSFNDKPYILAYVAKESKWYTLSVIDDGKILYGRAPANFMERELYLPPGTTEIKTKLISGPTSYRASLQVKEAYYNKPATCTDCHSSTNHDPLHTQTGISENCTACHQDNLTREHDRVSQAGVQLDCDTCHDSSNTTVQDAVYNKTKGCAVCHPNAGDHESAHVSVIDGGLIRESEMSNNLSNPGCISCHANYPSQHATNKCSLCHIGGVNTSAMWNCRYCHLTKVYDTYKGFYGVPDYTGSMSGFRSYGDPLHNGTLGTKNWWQAGHYGNGGIQYAPPNPPQVDADFNYHNNSAGFQHNSNSITEQCALCHKKTLTAEHTGKTRVTNNPTENFEDGFFTFNFTGYWGGEFVRTSDSAYTGTYSFKSMPVGGSASRAPIPSATTETTVDVSSAGNISFVYKVISSGKFSFYIDGVEMLANAAATTWTPLSYPLTPGKHTLKWKSTWSSVYIDDLAVTGAATTYKTNCDSCHMSSDPAVKAAIAGHNSSCTACHTMVNSHVTDGKTVLDNKCTTCHQSSVTKEHDRVNSAGEQLNCATCHNSNDSAVKEAIETGNANCANCHEQAGHVNTHTSTTLDANCLSCHSNSLVTEHMDNATTSGKNYNCHTCHANNAQAIERAITYQLRKCTNCHNSGHNLSFTEQWPADLPLHTGFNWSSPIKAALFSGELATPSGYDDGYVVISNRRPDINAASVLSYCQETLGAQGWTMTTSPPAPEAQKFMILLEKAGHSITLEYFNTNQYDSNVVNTGGYRLEIWYK